VRRLAAKRRAGRHRAGRLRAGRHREGKRKVVVHPGESERGEMIRGERAAEVRIGRRAVVIAVIEALNELNETRLVTEKRAVTNAKCKAIHRSRASAAREVGGAGGVDVARTVGERRADKAVEGNAIDRRIVNVAKKESVVGATARRANLTRIARRIVRSGRQRTTPARLRVNCDPNRLPQVGWNRLNRLR
jgi:hypothetical protein